MANGKTNSIRSVLFTDSYYTGDLYEKTLSLPLNSVSFTYYGSSATNIPTTGVGGSAILIRSSNTAEIISINVYGRAHVSAYINGNWSSWKELGGGNTTTITHRDTCLRWAA